MSLQFPATGQHRPGSQPTRLLPSSTTRRPPQTEDDEPPPPYSQHDIAKQETSYGAFIDSFDTQGTMRNRASSSITQTHFLPHPFPLRLALLHSEASTPVGHEYVIAADIDPDLHDPAPRQLEHLYAVTLTHTTHDPNVYSHANGETSSAYDHHPLFASSVSPIPDLVIHSTHTVGTSPAPLVTARSKGDGGSKDENPTSNDTLLRMQHISPFASRSLYKTGPRWEKTDSSHKTKDYPQEKGPRCSPSLSTPAPSLRARSNSSHTSLRDLPLASSIEERLIAQTDYPSVMYSFSTCVDAAAAPISMSQDLEILSTCSRKESRGRTILERFEWRRAPALNPMAAIGLDADGGSGRKGKKKKQAKRLAVYLDLLLSGNDLGNDEDGDGYMWQLVRCQKPGDQALREAGIDADVAIFKGEMTDEREEVVAVWTFAGRGSGGGLMGKLDFGWKRLSMRSEGPKTAGWQEQRVLLFKFLGTGATGTLGERWSLLAVASAVRMYQVLKT